MTSAIHDVAARSSLDFVQSSILEAVVPSNGNVDIESLYRTWTAEGHETEEALLPFVEQRHFLLLDELVPLFIVLRTSSSDAQSIERFLPRLSITVEAFATGHVVAPMTSQNSGETSPHPVHAKDLLHSQTLDSVEHAITLSNPDQPTSSLYLVWRTSIFIGRPKARLQKLGIYFAVAATLQATIPQEIHKPHDEYLPSGLPTTTNLFEAFVSDPAVCGFAPHLPVSKIIRGSPSSPVLRDISSRPIKSAPRRIFRAGPGLAWRIRFTRVPTSQRTPTLVASLDIEATPFASCNVQIETVDLTLVNGHAELLTPANHPSLPALCGPGDQLTFLSKLTPGPEWEHSTENVYALNVDIVGHALIADDCRPQINIKWKTNIDITPSAPRPTTSSRPDTPGKDSQNATEPPQQLQKNATALDLGMTLTILGPDQVYVGEIFHWSIFVVNRSSVVRRFAILVVPKRSTGRPSRHEGHLSASSADLASQDESKGIADAVVDENAVYAQIRRGAIEPAELVSLSPDVRIGPLGVSACYTTEMRFLALVKGVLRIDSLRVVDLATQETTDIRDLPDIVAVERVKGP